jgi:hypothetical protein
MTMKKILAGALSGLLLLASAVQAADKPLVMQSGQVKQLPAATGLQLQAPTTANATINLPHGTAPTSPANGDCWTTTAGLYCRINSSTVGPYNLISLTGDVSGSGTGSIAATLATVNSNVGSFGSASAVPVVTVNGKGLVTAVSTAALAPIAASGSASNLSAGTVPAARMPALTGDVTTSAGSIATTLATVNSNVGSFGSATQSLTATVNGKGLITAVSAQTVTPAVGSITGLGTGVATALATSVGSAGAPVLLNGAGGTPSSLTLTNATGLPIAGLTASTATAIGVGSVELGHATDTTIARSSAGNVTVEGNALYRVGGTDVAVADGGTGASDASGARTNLGAEAAITAGTAAQVWRGDKTWVAPSTFAREVGARVRNGAAQSIPTATSTVVTFPTARRVTNVTHDTSATGKLTALEDGWYTIGVSAEFVANATGVRLLQLKLNGTTYIASTLLPNAGASLPTRLPCNTVYYLVAGDYVQVEAYQDSGGNLDINHTQAYTAEFFMVKVGAAL